MILEELPDLSPVQFFSLSWDCPYLKDGSLKANDDTSLPDVSEFTAEESFADLYMAWNEEKIAVEAHVRDRTAGDSIELFFDMRDLKTKSHISKFCHHFIFTPDEREGAHGYEATRFYNDDMHRLCDSDDFEIFVDAKEGSYTMKIEIPAHCLFGYDPRQFPRMGFTYRVNRMKASSQHFAVSSVEVPIEQHPALWATGFFTGGGK